MQNSTISVDVSKQVTNDFLTYVVSTSNRAIPDAVDGLKVSHRRIVQTCLLNNYVNLVKTAKISGSLMGTLHPHGDSSAVIQNLANSSDYLQPLLKLQGNPGGYSVESRQKISSDSAASGRYTESALAALAPKLFDLVIATKPNYDGTMREVVQYSTALPLSLLNANSGIGTGYATNTVGFPAKNIVNAIAAIINKEPVAIVKALGVPDFAHNCNIVKTNGLLELHETGKGNILLQGEWQINEQKRELVITKLANGNVDQFIDQIKAGIQSEKIVGIAKIVDETAKTINVIISWKKSANSQELLGQLLANTNLQYTFNANLTFVEKLLPKVFTPSALLQLWYSQRATAVSQDLAIKLNVNKQKLEIAEGLFSLLGDIRDIVDIIVSSDNEQAAMSNIKSVWDCSDLVVNEIMKMSLKKLVKTNKEQLAHDIAVLKEDIDKLITILSTEETLHAYILKLAEECLQFCLPRVSNVIKQDETIVSTQQALVVVNSADAKEAARLKANEASKRSNAKKRAANPRLAMYDKACKLFGQFPAFNGMKDCPEEQLFKHILNKALKLRKPAIEKMSIDEMRAKLREAKLLK